MSMIQRNQQINWESYVNAAKGTTITYINDWIAKTYIRVGTVNGSVARVPPGGLESRTTIDLSVLLRSALMQIPGAPAQFTDEFARQVWRTWKQWYQEVELFLPVAFPTFAAYPGRYAPLTPATQGYLFVLAFMPTQNKCLNPILKQKLIKVTQDFAQNITTQSHQINSYGFNKNDVAAGGWKGNDTQNIQQVNAGYKATPNAPASNLTPQKAMENYADWFNETLNFWKNSASISNLLGEGPIPSFNGVTNLIGPVVKGTLKGERVLTGRFVSL
jgi:hypothetical protein